MSRTILPAAILAVVLPLLASEPPPVRIITADSSLVLVPVSVTDALGAPVTGLHMGDFQLYEDNVEQKISHFALEDTPVSVGVLFDVSGSMRHKMRESSGAVAAFLRQTNPADEFFLVEFGERARLRIPFTGDSDEIFQRVARTRPFGRTSLLDAIHVALAQMKRAQNRRKALVILSDGGDNRSRFSRGQIQEAMAESDVQLYAIGIFEQDGPAKLTPEERGGPILLSVLSDRSGGRLYTVKSLDELPAVGERIGNDLRTEYVLGYSSSNDTRDGKYRHIRVRVASPREHWQTTYRRGYHQPSQ